MSEERPPLFDPRQTLALLAPGAVGALTWLVSSGTPTVQRSVLALCGALATAVVIQLWLARRVGGLVSFVRRVKQGERARPPLGQGLPDGLDGLALELGELETSIGREITRLAYERDRLEAVLGAMTEGVLVLDESGRVLRANDRVREIFGIETIDGSLAGRRLWDLSRDVEFNSLVREAIEGKRPKGGEIELRGALERTLLVSVGVTADRNAWVLVLRDTTETKQLERMRTDFVANVSHELRTPLTAIKGFAETLEVGLAEGDERNRRYASIIDRQAGRLARIIDDLLILSDLELGRMPIQVKPILLAPVIQDVVELLSEAAARRGVTLHVDASAPIRVIGDSTRLAQVASNLLDNAIKFTPEGGEVRVTASSEPEDGFARLAFADTGVGIPEDDLPRLAERFYRVDKARSSELGGTGLGLSIVKHIVLAHGGTFEIDSLLGRGTTVTVRIPLADEE